MDQPRISARAFITRDDKVLVAAYRDDRGPWYVLPGGGQQRGESLAECLLREFKEEAGTGVSIGRLRWVREFISDNHTDSNLDEAFHQVEMIFECELADGDDVSLGIGPDPGQTGLHWLTAQELTQLRFYPEHLAKVLTGQAEDTLYLGDTQ
ncbi:MAG: NUDIX domain-containing protein [Planctomycetota bacterium]|jgi:8-oxo-dGTP pyrophosphatase MutT (NUDIX family)